MALSVVVIIMRKWFTRIVLVLLVLYGAVLAFAYFTQEKFLFHPYKYDQYTGYEKYSGMEEVFLTTKDSQRINGLYFPADDTSDRLVIYYHGNAGTLLNWQYLVFDFKELGYNFLIIDYRGYGKSTGPITEKGMYLDGQAAYDYAISRGFKPDHIVVYGRSLGTAIATDVAAHNKVQALVLEAPFTGIKRLATKVAPFLLPQLHLKYDFDNLAKINQIDCPLMVIHGTMDPIVPYAEGQELYDTFSGPKKEISIPGGGHGSVSGNKYVMDDIRAFCMNAETGSPSITNK